jgi:hypothetical protein
MPDLHKTLILAQVRPKENDATQFVVEELAMATEHAPFRHKKREVVAVGSQQKKMRTNDEPVTVADEEKSAIEDASAAL